MRFTDSLRKNSDFKQVYRGSSSKANRYLVMYQKKNETYESEECRNRLGISVSKKVGNSVIRHRVKRLIKESYRLQEDVFDSGLDIVIVARESSKDASYQEIESALLHLAGLQGILK